MSLDPNHRERIESTLGRVLLDEELASAPSLDRLPEPMLAVARTFVRCQCVLCVIYLRAATDAPMRDAVMFMDELLTRH